MIKLQSIRIRNFRAIADVTFKPLTDGITGISGSNGAGKTTFLSATLFALFGEKPPEASVASLRRIGSTGECSVSVVFTHLKQTVEIVREIKGKSNKILVDIYVDGVPQTVTSVNAADLWITQRLGVDATGFLTAFVVRQKELDQLITARPAERKRIIERLAGIDTINHALKAAREDENSAKKVLATLPGSEELVTNAEEQLNMFADRMEQLDANWNQAQTQQRTLSVNQKTLQSQVDAMKEIEFAVYKKETELATQKTELSTLTNANLKFDYLKEIGEIGNINDLRQQHVSVNEKLNSKLQLLATYRAQQHTAVTDLARLKNNLSGLTEELSNLVEPVQSVEKIQEDSFSKEGQLSGNRTRQSVLNSKAADLQSSISILEHSTECPTCHTDLDDPTGLVQRFTEEVTAYHEEVVELQKEEQLLLTAISELKQSVVSAIRYAEVKDSIVAINKEIDALQSDDKAELIEKLEVETSELDAEKTRITELGFKAKTFAEDTAQLEKNASRIKVLDGFINSSEVELQDLNKQFSPDKLSKLRAFLNKAQNELDAQTPVLEIMSNERSTTNSKLSMAKVNYKATSDQWKRKQELMYQQQRLALTTDMIDKYRSNTISSLAPNISEYATSLIGEITNGDFTDVLLDDEFNASAVEAGGVTKPVSWLSGGEVSAVALSLRVAISLLITDGNPELLWLDEVLTAQDADRRTAMLSMIRGLPIDQIIMINHTHEAADIVDKTISLNIDRENGSYIADEEI